MDMSYVTNQLEEAKYNYNYFFMKMIIKVLQVCFKLSFILLLSSIFNYLIINSVSSSNKWQWFISNTSFNGWPGAKSSLDGTDAIIGSPSIAV